MERAGRGREVMLALSWEQEWGLEAAAAAAAALAQSLAAGVLHAETRRTPRGACSLLPSVLEAQNPCIVHDCMKPLQAT